MDLVMPEREGIETIQEIRSDYPVLPIIAVSGAFEGTMLKAAQCLGANATIRKPFGMQVLLDTIRLPAIPFHAHLLPILKTGALTCKPCLETNQ